MSPQSWGPPANTAPTAVIRLQELDHARRWCTYSAPWRSEASPVNHPGHLDHGGHRLTMHPACEDSRWPHRIHPELALPLNRPNSSSSSGSSTSAGATGCANVSASASPSSGEAWPRFLHVGFALDHRALRRQIHSKPPAPLPLAGVRRLNLGHRSAQKNRETQRFGHKGCPIPPISSRRRWAELAGSFLSTSFPKPKNRSVRRGMGIRTLYE
jgi:hypothetical protein